MQRRKIAENSCLVSPWRWKGPRTFPCMGSCLQLLLNWILNFELRLPFVRVSSDNSVRENPHTWQQRPSVQRQKGKKKKPPTGLLLLLHRLPYKQSRAEWSFVVRKRASWPSLLAYLFIYLSDKPFSNGCCHRQLPGLSRGNVRVFCWFGWWLGSELIGFFFFPPCGSCTFCFLRGYPWPMWVQLMDIFKGPILCHTDIF